MKKAEQFSTH